MKRKILIFAILFSSLYSQAESLEARDILKTGLVEANGSASYFKSEFGQGSLNINLSYGQYITDHFAYLLTSAIFNSTSSTYQLKLGLGGKYNFYTNAAFSYYLKAGFSSDVVDNIGAYNTVGAVGSYLFLRPNVALDFQFQSDGVYYSNVVRQTSQSILIGLALFF